MIQHLLLAIGSTVGLSLLWLGVMSLVRRQNPGLPVEADVIGDRTHCMEHNCSGCSLPATGRSLTKEQCPLAEGTIR